MALFDLTSELASYAELRQTSGRRQQRSARPPQDTSYEISSFVCPQPVQYELRTYRLAHTMTKSVAQNVPHPHLEL